MLLLAKGCLEKVEEEVGTLSVLIVLALCFWIIWLKPHLTRRNWEAFAAEHGLMFKGSTLRIRTFDQSPFWLAWGVYRERAIRLEAYTRYTPVASVLSALSLSNTGTPSTRISRGVLTAKPGTLSLELRQRSPTRPSSPIKTGDVQFDRMFAIDSSPPDLAICVFGSKEIRDRARSLKGDLILDALGLRYEAAGLVRDANRLRFLVNLLADLSAAIESVELQYGASET